MPSRPLRWVVVAAIFAAAPAFAAEWTPAAWADESTLELRTQESGAEAHWFPVWLVVLDGEVYVRLGSRAAKRIESNAAGRLVGVRIAGQEFDEVEGVPAPERVEAVAAAMAEKYTTDVVIRWFSHPLTLRLVPR
jgi:hypothetical protein